MGRTLLADDLAALPDAELVGRFVERRDDAAFTALVRRHGTLVLGVCRRVLRHEQDAEDAFQATFLIFARDAVRMRRAGAVGNWLYGVAYNVARRVRTARTRRSAHEQHAAAQKLTELPAGVPDDLRAILDAELNALPGKYRAPIVLCDLMGLTTSEAAAEVGCPPKTLGTRLSRGRSLLARRLTRRGVSLSVAGLAAVLTPSALGAAVPPQLVEFTVQAATGFVSGSAAAVTPAVVALTQGVSNVMILNTIKLAAVLISGALILGGVAKYGGFAAQAGPEPLVVLRADDNKEDKDKPAISGVWVLKDGEMKLDFSEKDRIAIFPHGENKVIVVNCEYTRDKDGVVKAKITGFDGKEEAKKIIMEKLPVGTEFTFKWKVKDDTATIGDVKGEKVELLKSRLEGDYTKK
jgi:RNA polymerase sigma factor (sigma-70 family)